MAASPIEIKDYVNKITSTRKELLDEENGKIRGNKGFVFSSFKTEKQRLEEYLRQKNTIYNPINIHQLQTPNITNKQWKITQPNMRFKPRTDFERLYDAINEYSFGRVDKEIIDKHLQSLELNTAKKYQDEIEFDDCVPDYYFANKSKKKLDTARRQKEFRAKLLEERNERKNKNKRKFVDKSSAKQFMSDLHNKTHFKAATNYTIFRDTSMIKSNIRGNRNMNMTNSNTNNTYMDSHNNRTTERGSPSSRNIMTEGCISTASNQYTNTTYSNNNNSNTVYSYSTASKKIGLTENADFNRDVIQSNPLLYNINANPFKKTKDNEKTDPVALRYLKNIAFSNKPNLIESELDNPTNKSSTKKFNFFLKLKQSKKALPKLVGTDDEHESLMKHNPVSFFQKFSDNPNFDMEIKKADEDKIVIDGSEYYRSEIDQISKKILTKCNYLHKKNKNNNTSLKLGDGKLMITNGLTVTEFTKKYNLKI